MGLPRFAIGSELLVENRPPAEKGKYVTFAVLLTVVVAIFLWTFVMHW